MQAEYYTDKSIAVFGDTKPWATNLRNLNGKFNNNLKGRPGWIFQRSKEAEIMQFIAQANGGIIQAQPATTATSPSASMVPIGYSQPALTPQAAMARLTIAQPLIPTPLSSLTNPIFVPKPTSPGVAKPFTPLQPQPSTLNYPNLFRAADGLSYQVVIYTLPLPELNQRLTLSVGGNNIEYIVTNIVKSSPPFDSIYITQSSVESDIEPAVSQAVVINGEWKINGMQTEHRLVFH